MITSGCVWRRESSFPGVWPKDVAHSYTLRSLNASFRNHLNQRCSLCSLCIWSTLYRRQTKRRFIHLDFSSGSNNSFVPAAPGIKKGVSRILQDSPALSRIVFLPGLIFFSCFSRHSPVSPLADSPFFVFFLIFLTHEPSLPRHRSTAPPGSRQTTRVRHLVRHSVNIRPRSSRPRALTDLKFESSFTSGVWSHMTVVPVQ